jgi:hypothetical protein
MNPDRDATYAIPNKILLLDLLEAMKHPRQFHLLPQSLPDSISVTVPSKANRIKSFRIDDLEQQGATGKEKNIGR